MLGLVAYDDATCRKLFFVVYLTTHKCISWHPSTNGVIVNGDVRIVQSFQLNQVDDGWFATKKSMDLHGGKAQNYGKSSSNDMQEA